MHDTICPGLLAAPPSLLDPNFHNALIAVAMHEKDGSMGFILSKQTNLNFHELVKDLNIEPKIPDRPVLYGGPISRTSGYVIYEHEKDSPIASGLYLCDTISISPSKEILELAAHGKLPGRFELILGYTGWGPGQLEKEIASGGWLHTHMMPEIIFDVTMKKRWEYAFSQIGVSPYGFISVPGGAQA